MAKLGYIISSEEMSASQILESTKLAENSDFSYLGISDHFHPWIDAQGQSTFVWSMLGAISQITKRLDVITAVTAPMIRIHPVIMAQAVATTALLFNNRFSWGVGTGENLNEHVVGLGWPSYRERVEMFKESIEMIRELWKGKLTTIDGSYFTVDSARIYSLPETLPPIIISGFGPKSTQMAGEIGDGFMATGADKNAIKIFEKAGGKGKPKYGQLKVVVNPSVEKAKEIAHTYWPFSGIGQQAHQELRVPKHFEELGSSATPDDMDKQVVCGNDPQKHLAKIQEFIDAGFTHIGISQIGSDQKQFFEFYKKEIFPKLS